MGQMILKNLNWGYDAGKVAGDYGDGYLNVELELEGESDRIMYLWMSRCWEYETVMIGEMPMFSIAMHMTHYDADFDLEMAYLDANAEEQYEYLPLELPEDELKNSDYYKEILFAREALNCYFDLEEEQREQLVLRLCGQEGKKELLDQTLYLLKNTKKQ